MGGDKSSRAQEAFPFTHTKQTNGFASKLSFLAWEKKNQQKLCVRYIYWSIIWIDFFLYGLQGQHTVRCLHPAFSAVSTQSADDKSTKPTSLGQLSIYPS